MYDNPFESLQNYIDRMNKNRFRFNLLILKKNCIHSSSDVISAHDRLLSRQSVRLIERVYTLFKKLVYPGSHLFIFEEFL